MLIPSHSQTSIPSKVTTKSSQPENSKMSPMEVVYIKSESKKSATSTGLTARSPDDSNEVHNPYLMIEYW